MTLPPITLIPLGQAVLELGAGHWLAQALAQQDADDDLSDALVLRVQGDLHLSALDLQAPLAAGTALCAQLPAHLQAHLPAAARCLLIHVQGALRIGAALVDHGWLPRTHLHVDGDLHCANALLSQGNVTVQGSFHAAGLLWCGDGTPADDEAQNLRVQGELHAAAAVFTQGFHVHVHGPERIGLCCDAARAEPSHAALRVEALAQALAPHLLQPMAPATDGAQQVVDMQRLLAALQAGQPVLRSPAMPSSAGTDPIDTAPTRATLCPGEAVTLAHLHQLVKAALPDKSRLKAQGWFGQTDFLITRRHQDEEGDTYHDGVFLTEWKAWDFWFSDVPPPEPLSLLAAAAAGLRRLASAPLGGAARPAPGFMRLYRGYGEDGGHGPWLPMDGPDAQVPPAALRACDRAWRGLIDYWRKAEAERRAGRPLRQQLMAALSPARIEALTLLPVFTAQYNDWWDSDRNGWWEGDLWVGARQPCVHHGKRWGRALKLSWQLGTPGAGDEEDDPHACYQIELDRSAATAAATTAGSAVHITYTQRQSDERVPLPADAVDHMARLLRLFTGVEHHLLQAEARQHEREADTRRIEQAVQLLAAPPFAETATDASIFPTALLAASEAWQADGRAYVAQMRERLLAPDGGWTGMSGTPQTTNATPEAAQAGGHDPAHDPAQDTVRDTAQDAAPHAAPWPQDSRRHRAATVLQLARVISRHDDAGLAARLHRRFAFAPDVFAQRARQSGQPVGPVLLQGDGSVIARVGPDGGAHTHWVHVGADALSARPHSGPERVDGAPPLQPEEPAADQGQGGGHIAPPSRPPSASVRARGLAVQGDASGYLHGLDEDGHVLWHHQVGGCITGVDVSADGRTIVAGSDGGYLVLLRKAPGPDAFVVGTSRFAEARRFIFWTDEPAVIRW